MRILFLSPRQCWPPVSGAKLREFHLARALGRHAELTLVFFAQAGAMPPRPEDLPFCREVVGVPAPRRFTPLQIARGLCGRWPLPVVHYLSPEMKSAVARLTAGGRFDFVHLDGLPMAGYLPMVAACGARVVCNWYDITSEMMRRYRQHAPSAVRGWYAAATVSRLAAVERHLLRDAFGHLVCSQRERAQLLGIAPDARIAVVENGVDSGFFARPDSGAGPRHRVVFVGDMGYTANVDAAVWFTRSMWPRLHSRFPDLRLTLVGSNPAAAVQALRTQGGVEITGTVADVRPYYGEALAAIVPLRIGSGTRLKILEAMAAGVPVISTTIGAEGLMLSAGEDLLIADRDEDWVACVEALEGDGVWKRLSTAGREVARRYDWGTIGDSLWTTYRGWLDGLRG